MKRLLHRKQPGYRRFLERAPRTPSGRRWRLEKWSDLQRASIGMLTARMRAELDRLPLVRISVPPELAPALTERERHEDDVRVYTKAMADPFSRLRAFIAKARGK